MEVYLDNAATTRPYEEVIDEVAKAMRNTFANPSAKHILGVRAEQKLSEARQVMGRYLNCSKEEIIFTSGGSESNNLAIKGFCREGLHMITTSIEHSSVRKTFKEIETQGVKVTYLRVDKEGRIDLEHLKESLNKDTVLVSIMHVNNETGVIQDLKAIGEIIKNNSSRAKFHVDAVQSFGKFTIDVEECNIDLLAISAHKFHGPRGIGAMYIRKGVAPKPLIIGGGQEKGFRSGTENLPGVLGMALAAEKIYANIEENYIKVKELKEYFMERLKGFDNIKINSPMEDFISPYLLSVSFLGLRGEVILHMLEEKGVYVSTGSACSSKAKMKDSVLYAMGFKDNEIAGTVRFSFNENNTKEEIDYVIEVLNTSLRFLRRVKK